MWADGPSGGHGLGGRRQLPNILQPLPAEPPGAIRTAGQAPLPLVLEGVVVRSVSVGGRQGLELFGAGDLVRPFEPAGESQVMVPA